jgi:magnesium chelatase family protein
VHVPPVLRAALGDEAGESSAAVAARVAAARDAQRVRWSGGGWVTNGLVPGHVLRRPPFRLPGRATAVLDRQLDSGRLTLRGYDRVLRVSWSAADLAGRSVPDGDDVAMGLSLRTGELVAA